MLNRRGPMGCVCAAGVLAAGVLGGCQAPHHGGPRPAPGGPEWRSKQKVSQVEAGDSVIASPKDPMSLSRRVVFRVSGTDEYGKAASAVISLAPIPDDGSGNAWDVYALSEPDWLMVHMSAGDATVRTYGLRPFIRTRKITAGAPGTIFRVTTVDRIGDVIEVIEHSEEGVAVLVTTNELGPDGQPKQRVELRNPGEMALCDDAGGLRPVRFEELGDSPVEKLAKARRGH